MARGHIKGEIIWNLSIWNSQRLISSIIDGNIWVILWSTSSLRPDALGDNVCSGRCSLNKTSVQHSGTWQGLWGMNITWHPLTLLLTSSLLRSALLCSAAILMSDLPSNRIDSLLVSHPYYSLISLKLSLCCLCPLSDVSAACVSPLLVRSPLLARLRDSGLSLGLSQSPILRDMSLSPTTVGYRLLPVYKGMTHVLTNINPVLIQSVLKANCIETPSIGCCHCH